VLVAGAGVADLVAATRLPTAGFDFVVLEIRHIVLKIRDRVGGHSKHTVEFNGKLNRAEAVVLAWMC
jgi:monoamine oxidase